MIARILVGLGGARSTPSAIRYAVHVALDHQADVVGVTVLDRERQVAEIGRSGTSLDALRDFDSLDSLQKQQDRAIVDFEAACANAGLRYEVTRESGRPFEQLAMEARYGDLIVLGQPAPVEYDLGRTDSFPALTRLMSRGVRPLLIAPQGFQPIGRVLLYYDGTIASANAVKRFVQMQLWPDVAVKIVSCLPAGETADGSLSDIASYCQASGCKAEVERLPGSARRTLLKHASDWCAQLIVIGSSKRCGVKRFFGDITTHAIRNANVPLFLSQ